MNTSINCLIALVLLTIPVNGQPGGPPAITPEQETSLQTDTSDLITGDSATVNDTDVDSNSTVGEGPDVPNTEDSTGSNEGIESATETESVVETTKSKEDEPSTWLIILLVVLVIGLVLFAILMIALIYMKTTKVEKSSPQPKASEPAESPMGPPSTSPKSGTALESKKSSKSGATAKKPLPSKGKVPRTSSQDTLRSEI